MPTIFFRYARLLGFGVFLCFAAGCDRRGIEVYSVDKEDAVGESPLPAVAAVRLPEPPDGSWQAIDPAGGPRLASFRISGSDGGEAVADMGVTVFPGAAGGLLANVNRWRNEMGQPPLGEGQLAEALREVELGGHTIQLMDTASEERRTLGGILPLATETWFFKLSGPLAIVGEQESAFLDYLAGLQISSAAGGARGVPELDDLPPARPQITYQAPTGWVEGESTTMRVASFSVTGDGDGAEADIAVIPLGGSGGAQLMILNQWRATLRLDAATEAELPGMIELLEIGGHSYQLVDLESEAAMLDGDRKARILVAFTTVGEHTWFFKIAGETGLVADQRPALIEFLNSVEFPPK